MTNDNELKVLMVEIQKTELTFSRPMLNEIPSGAVLCWEISGVNKDVLLGYAAAVGELEPELLICVGANSSFFAQIIEEEIFFQEQDEFQEDIIDPNVEVFESIEPAIFFGWRYLDRNPEQNDQRIYFLNSGNFGSIEEKISKVFKNFSNN